MTTFGFSFISTKRLVVRGLLNGYEASFLIGTGTYDSIILNGEVLRNLAISTQELGMYQTALDHTAVRGESIVESISVLDRNLSYFTAPVLNDFPDLGGDIAGIVGSSFFMDAVLRIDLSTKQIALERNGEHHEASNLLGELRLSGAYLPLPVTKDVSECHIGRTRNPLLLIDTGSSISLLGEEYLSRDKRNPLTRLAIRKALRSEQCCEWGFRLRGGEDINAFVGIRKGIFGDSLKKIDGVLGMDVLGSFNTVVFDFPQRTCQLSE